MFRNLTDAVVRGDLVEDEARFAERVRDGAVEVKDESLEFHRGMGKWLDEGKVRMDVIGQG